MEIFNGSTHKIPTDELSGIKKELETKWLSSVADPFIDKPLQSLECYGWSALAALTEITNMFAEQIQREYLDIQPNEPFLVGNDWFEIVETPQRDGTTKKELLKLKEKTIKLTYGKDFDFGNAPKFKDFVNINNILAYRQTIYQGENARFFNIFPRPNFSIDGELIRKLKTGLFEVYEIRTCLKLLHHIFGKQWYIGLQYLALLIQKPSQFLPVLCLVSKENQTGKSTFAYMLKCLLGDCVGFYSNSDLKSDFNTFCLSHVAVFEEISNAKNSVNLIKDLSTTTRKTVNKKNQDQKEYDVNVHIVLNSNNETDFINASDDDIRYWVVKVPPLESYDPDFDKKIKEEARCFFYFLATFPHLGKKKSRMWFDVKELETSELEILRKTSKSECAKSIIVWALDICDTTPDGFFYATPTDIQTFARFNYPLWDIIRALKHELHLEPCKLNGNSISYKQICTNVCRAGKPYRFCREDLEKMAV